jgi:hypothetical protein
LDSNQRCNEKINTQSRKLSYFFKNSVTIRGYYWVIINIYCQIIFGFRTVQKKTGRLKMKFRHKGISIIAISLLIISLSLNIVFAATQGAEPGSDQDPIVSKSYVDAAVNQLAARVQLLLEQNDSLKNQNAQLTTRVEAQEQALKSLQEAVKSGGGASGTKGDTGSTGGTAANPTASAGQCVVNVPVLNIRTQPNTTSDIVMQVVKNEMLNIVSSSGGWYKITTSAGTSGYVLGRLVTVKK